VHASLQQRATLTSRIAEKGDASSKGLLVPEKAGERKEASVMITEKGFLQTTTEAGTSQKGHANRKSGAPRRLEVQKAELGTQMR